MFFSAAVDHPTRRTLSIARTKNLDGPWTLDAEPILPAAEQVENSSLYFEPANQTWFLFTNHVGIDGFEYTDAVWVYWSKDLNRWDPAHKAVVLDRQQLHLVQAHHRAAFGGAGWRPAGLVLRRQRRGEDAPGRQEPHEPRHRAGMAATAAGAAQSGKVKAMTITQPVTDLIRRRFSCRRYSAQPIPAQTQDSLWHFLKSMPPGPFGSPMRFQLVAATEKDRSDLKSLGTYGFIRAQPPTSLGQ